MLLFTSDDEFMKARKLVKWMVKRAIALGGTCTGEHGVGIGKREYLCEELGYGTVELMKKIKRTIDPLNLFNPGKVSVNSSPCSDQLCSTRTGVPGFIAKRCLGELIVRPMMPPIGGARFAWPSLYTDVRRPRLWAAANGAA